MIVLQLLTISKPCRVILGACGRGQTLAGNSGPTQAGEGNEHGIFLLNNATNFSSAAGALHSYKIRRADFSSHVQGQIHDCRSAAKTDIPEFPKAVLKAQLHLSSSLLGGLGASFSLSSPKNPVLSVQPFRYWLKTHRL